MRAFVVWLVAFGLSSSLPVNTQEGGGTKKLLIRCDDIGMCHSVNMAVERLAQTGIRFSASVLFVCPWYPEAAAILKKYPNVAVGVHLAVNSEWQNYRWGPVLGRSAVPSLVDPEGYFFPTASAFEANNPSLNEIETELRAQIGRALRSGLHVSYLDYHMNSLYDNPDYRKLVLKLAAEYHLAVSGELGEKEIEPMYWIPVERKARFLSDEMESLSDTATNFIYCHIIVDTPEADALVDNNPEGLKDVGKNRQAELDALTSPDFLRAVNMNKIELINYVDLSTELQKIGGKQKIH